tara:strand:- start:5479 stop:5772 length:294 start_codon:yes stop_codon:yes gene_type:complete
MRTLHLRIFTNRDEEEDNSRTDNRQTACGLPDTPHHLAEQRIAPDCHINVFKVMSSNSDVMVKIAQMGTHSTSRERYEVCKTCKKRFELMTSLGGFA